MMSCWKDCGLQELVFSLVAKVYVRDRRIEIQNGKSFTDILENRVIKPLGLNRTYYYTPPDEVGVIPGTIKDTYWNVYLGDASP